MKINRPIPNGIQIFIPILNISPDLLILKNTTFQVFESFDNNLCLGGFKIKNILKDASFNLNLRDYRRFIEIDFRNKIKITLDLCLLESKNTSGIPLHFLKLELQNPLKIVNFSRFINRSIKNREDLCKLISNLILDRSTSKEKIEFAKYLIDNEISIPLLHFNIIYYNFNEDVKEISDIYHTYNQEIINPQFYIALNSTGRTILWIIKKKTIGSIRNLKIMVIRSFLMRFFSWLSNRDLKIEFSDLMNDFSIYYSNLKSNSRSHIIYSKIMENIYYRIEYIKEIRFSKSELENKLNRIKNEESFRENIIKPILEDLGFNNIQIMHGVHEYGIDILFTNTNKFGLIEWNAVVAKIGNINLSEGSKLSREIDLIFDQIWKAKCIEQRDINFLKLKITRVFVITNKKINYHAKKALLSMDFKLKGSIFFIDSDILLSLTSP